MDRVVVVLLTLLVALVGADRINLLAGAGGFILTPFLTLTPLVAVAEALRMRSTRATLRLPSQTPHYLLAATALLCVIGVSALLSEDPVLSGKRTMLLVAQIYGALILALILLNQERPARILVRGAYLGLLLATVFNVLQVYLWVTGGWDPARPENELLINMAPRTYGSWLPRLSGTVVDQGRAGLLFVIYLFIVFRFAPRSFTRIVMLTIAVVSLLGTLSRAGILCALVAIGFHWARERRTTFSTSHVIAGSLALAGLILLLMFAPLLRDGSLAFLEPLSDRASADEGSSRMHFDLIEHGLIVATSSFRNALLGIGYGNALMVLEGFFPENRYANFHSYYVTLLTESGLLALLLGTWLLVYPFLLRWGPFIPLIAGFVAFGVFYQSTTEPAFWLFTALAWLTVGTEGDTIEGLRKGGNRVQERQLGVDEHALPSAIG